MDNFKTFYNEKNGKMILFFGFYFIFFIFLGFYMRSLNNNQPVPQGEQKEETKITSYSISNLINNEYSYDISINDNGEEIKFQGTKNNIDYANYPNKYFLDIYNINQLLKKSKLVNSENYTLTYELENEEINDILLTEVKDGINKIEVTVNDKTEVNGIKLDLSNYYEKNNYQIMISYEIGEKNENSPS